MELRDAKTPAILEGNASALRESILYIKINNKKTDIFT
jgi:hypothetical protein